MSSSTSHKTLRDSVISRFKLNLFINRNWQKLYINANFQWSMTSEVIKGHLFIQIYFLTFLWTTFSHVSIYVSIQFKFVYLSKFNLQNDGNLACNIYSSVRLFVYLASYLSTFFLSTYLDIFIYLLTYNTCILYLAWSMVGIWFLFS